MLIYPPTSKPVKTWLGPSRTCDAASSFVPPTNYVQTSDHYNQNITIISTTNRPVTWMAQELKSTMTENLSRLMCS